MKNSTAILALSAMLTIGISGAAMAQTADTTVAGHPVVNEVNQRLDDQNTRVTNGVNDGQLSATQAQKLDNHDAKISQSLSTDEAKNNGHLGPVQAVNLNDRLNTTSARIYNKKH